MSVPIINDPKVLYMISGADLQAFGTRCADIAVAKAQQMFEQQRSAENEPMFDKQDVAGIFKTSVRNVDKWIAEQRIIPTKIDGIVRFEGAEIARMKAVHKMNQHFSSTN